MPCIGPTPQEIAMMEADECLRLYGVRASELDIATRVACHLAKGESNDLTKRWIKEHNRRDRERAEQEAARRREDRILREVKAAERAIREKYKG